MINYAITHRSSHASAAGPFDSLRCWLGRTMKIKGMRHWLAAALFFSCCSLAGAADRIVIGNVSRTVEQLPNYAATDRGFFAQESIQGDVVLIGSTDTLIQALIAGQVNVAIVDPTPAINAVERGALLKIIGGTVPIAAYTLVGCP